MDPARTKALELAIVFSAGRSLETPEQLIGLADIFLAYIAPPEPTAADGDNYPRIQVS